MIKRTPNWKDGLELKEKCGACIHYTPFIKNEIMTARGRCGLKQKYKMRTETCLKYSEG